MPLRLGRAAEERARELLASAAGADALAMYLDLGFVAVDGREATGEFGEPEYGYLIYPHRPIVAYDTRSGEPLSEYCVRFQEGGDPLESRLPDADDVLAKWLALRADERRLIADANLDPVGRQRDPGQVRRDLRALDLWRQARAAEAAA